MRVRAMLLAVWLCRCSGAPPGAGIDLPLSAPGAKAFMPAGATDRSGRLHAIWYESDGAKGQLVYTRSNSSDFTARFSPPLVIDPDACPGEGWYPHFNSATGGRRLREYVDVAIDGNRAHLAWTHAPTAPSRVMTTYVEFYPE